MPLPEEDPRKELTFVHIEASEFLSDPNIEWLGVLGVKNAVEVVKRNCPEADMVVLTFNDFRGQ